jgi:succinate dehydrogenase / fumarate reductase membrane anchor subunit
VNLVSPLNRVLGLGSAKGGSEHWWLQRVTAVALIPLGLWLAISLLALGDYGYGAVVAWVQRPVTSILLILTVLVVSYHSYLGVQVVIEDYVHTAALKVSALIGSRFAHFGLAVAALFAILKLAIDPL